MRKRYELGKKNVEKERRRCGRNSRIRLHAIDFAKMVTGEVKSAKDGMP